MVPRVPSGKRKGHLGWVCAIRKVCRVTVARLVGVHMCALGGLKAGMCRRVPGGAWATMSKLGVEPCEQDWCV